MPKQAKPKQPRGYWVVAGGKIGEVGHCTRCGEGLRMELPQHIEVMAAAMKAFVKVHLSCREGHYQEPKAMTPHDWLKGRDTGISSCTICAVMINAPSPMSCYDVPHDPDDFGRCYRLLELFPDWKPRLPEVSAKFPEWTSFIREWSKLTAMYEEAVRTKATSAREMYDLMQVLETEGYALKGTTGTHGKQTV